DRGGRPFLRGERLGKNYKAGRPGLRALNEASFELWPGETLGVVGESGSGKTTLARGILGLTTPDAGSLLGREGRPRAAGPADRPQEQVKALQIVFQNPDSALNRSHSVRHLVGRAVSKLGGF